MRTRNLLHLFVLGLMCACTNQQPGPIAGPASIPDKVTAEQVLEQIVPPTIPAISISLLDFGAVGDSATDAKPAFDRALAALAAKGGGKLTVPRGTYLLNGPIHLTSHTELHLAAGAKLYFSSNPAHYLPVVPTSWEGTFVHNYSPMVYAYQCTNVALTGQGTINGQAANTWGNWKALQKEDQQLSRNMNHRHLPVSERVFGEGHFLRPQLVQFYNCENVLVEGIRMEDSPFWCLHMLGCQNVTIRAVSYHAHNKNNDGIDLELSRNVLIENVTFDNSDDNVAIKAGRDDDGWQANTPSENIVVRHCSFKGLHAIVVGSEMSAGVQNVFVHDCTFGGYLKRGIYLKSNPDRGGFIRNIYVDKVDFGRVEDCIYITSFYHNEGQGHATEIKDLYFSNIHCQNAQGTGVVIQGFTQKKVTDVHINRLQIDTATNAISMTATENIVTADVVIGQLATPPSFVK